MNNWGRLPIFFVSVFLSLTFFLHAEERYVPGEVIVKYKPGVRRDRPFMEGLYDSVRVTKIRRFRGRFQNIEQLKLAEGVEVERAVGALKQNPAVEYAQPNYILRIPESYMLRKRRASADAPERPPIASKPSETNPPQADPKLESAWGVAKVSAQAAWQQTKGSQDIIVAVIDTGVDYNHEDLSFNMWRNPNPKFKDVVGWDFVHNDHLPFDDHAHGTHCSGIVGAVGGNGKGISGVNQRVSIMALKFLSAEGSGETAAAIKAIDYAIEHGAKVLSNSWGGTEDEDNPVLLEAIKRAEQAGVLFVAAAGNDGKDNDTDKDRSFPAAFKAPNLISVAATDENDDMAFFSNFGKETVHLGAPGMNVYSTIPANRYKSFSGTSMACPHVAGAAALIWSLNPKMEWKEVRGRLLASVDPTDALKGKTVTGGRLNVARAVKGLQRNRRGGWSVETHAGLQTVY